jgi:hypothetical protein
LQGDAVFDAWRKSFYLWCYYPRDPTVVSKLQFLLLFFWPSSCAFDAWETVDCIKSSILWSISTWISFGFDLESATLGICMFENNCLKQLLPW